MTLLYSFTLFSYVVTLNINIILISLWLTYIIYPNLSCLLNEWLYDISLFSLVEALNINIIPIFLWLNFTILRYLSCILVNISTILTWIMIIKFLQSKLKWLICNFYTWLLKLYIYTPLRFTHWLTYIILWSFFYF